MFTLQLLSSVCGWRGDRSGGGGRVLKDQGQRDRKTAPWHWATTIVPWCLGRGTGSSGLWGKFRDPSGCPYQEKRGSNSIQPPFTSREGGWGQLLQEVVMHSLLTSANSKLNSWWQIFISDSQVCTKQSVGRFFLNRSIENARHKRLNKKKSDKQTKKHTFSKLNT